MDNARFSASDLTCLRGQRLVFAGLAFALSAGEALVLVGPNGSGKSSLLRLLALLLRPLRGELRWNGEPVADDPDSHRMRLRYVGHLDGVKAMLTCQESLAFWAALDGAPEPGRRATAALERLGLERLAAVPGRYLSAGQKRRLTLARLLLRPAPLWLLDEPTNGLDVAAIARLEAALAGHRAAGGMVIASTHTPLALPGAATLHLDDFTPDLHDHQHGESA
ncbi:MAG: heme ABC exporter ATP-binding protein CcmA [Rhodospirillaceae bacterium]